MNIFQSDIQGNLIPLMVRQAFMPFRVHHERNKQANVRPELVEGL
jgi:hypothetical protein